VYDRIDVTIINQSLELYATKISHLASGSEHAGRLPLAFARRGLPSPPPGEGDPPRHHEPGGVQGARASTAEINLHGVARDSAGSEPIRARAQ